ncbi:MAG: carbohydrate kinase family protein [Candidatus Nephthysia bennettiae]|nr:MAG: carbohydrate kinase family protein [Candidatus Dormibacteraeota bacterium]
MRAAVVAGHLCVDLVPELRALPSTGPGDLAEVGALHLSAGGCVANTGGDLAALGATVAAVGDVGDDELGAVLVHLLAERGTRTDQVRRLPGHSTSYSIVLQPPGRDRSFWHHVGANAAFDGSAVDLDGADLLHVGYPSLLPALMASDADPLVALLTRARTAGVTTSLDLAVLDPDSPAVALDWPGLLARILPLVDVMTPSADDMRTALRLEPEGLDETADRLVGLGAAVVMVTGGTDGLALRTANARRLEDAGALFADERRQRAWAGRVDFTPAPKVEVRTTLGAGDAATAGLLYGVLAGLDPGASLRLAAETAAARVAGAAIGRL